MIKSGVFNATTTATWPVSRNAMMLARESRIAKPKSTFRSVAGGDCFEVFSILEIGVASCSSDCLSLEIQNLPQRTAVIFAEAKQSALVHQKSVIPSCVLTDNSVLHESRSPVIESCSLEATGY